MRGERGEGRLVSSGGGSVTESVERGAARLVIDHSTVCSYLGAECDWSTEAFAQLLVGAVQGWTIVECGNVPPWVARYDGRSEETGVERKRRWGGRRW